MKKTVKESQTPSDNVIDSVAQKYGLTPQNLKTLLEQKGDMDEPTFCRLLLTDEQFREGQIDQLLFTDPSFAQEYVKKHNIDINAAKDVDSGEFRARLKAMLTK